MSGDRTRDEAEAWWSTAIIAMRPGEIRLRGHDVRDLIGNVDLVSMIWLMTRGSLPRPEEARLLEAALVAGVDHGPQAPSIAIARMAITCGVGINGAMASAVNTLGDVHGGAGEQALGLYERIIAVSDALDGDVEAAAQAVIAEEKAAGRHYMPGFGHRFHPLDPRAPRLLSLVDRAVAEGVVAGRHAQAGRAVEAVLARGREKPVPMNIDGITAIVYGELGFPGPLARGLFILSRSIGILSHAYEQSLEGARNKGPLPRAMTWRYTGENGFDEGGSGGAGGEA
ncbi:citryl-CoA lyase [Salinarimonas ramus]|uniref:citrate synthase (unknown stereospecificity) n=1 Tax=Salinarimonas ramus TaxID=690164 RepID=A0A917Q8K9_9HYPH|nr:citryl-CoA lyase [Salinarimonas ramus]GGK35016.1 citryl-CoA lyase [Salinarimonas ramus]